ncbi:hypothetical protein DSECCO2_195560 [anaerobic digester metagenome]
MKRRIAIVLSLIVFLFSLCAMLSFILQWSPLVRLIFIILATILYYLQIWLEKKNII